MLETTNLSCPALVSPLFLSGTASIGAISLLTFAGHSIFFVIVCRFQVFHHHVRLALLQTSVAGFFKLCSLLAIFCLSIHTAVSNWEGFYVPLHPLPRACVLIHMPLVFGVFLEIFAMGLLVMDRFVSTWKRDFTRPLKSSWSFRVQMAVTSGLCLALICFLSLGSLLHNDTPVCFCDPVFTVPPRGTLIIVSFSIVAEVLFLGIYGYIYQENKKLAHSNELNISAMTLSERFEVKINLQTVELLAPATLVHCVCNTLALACRFGLLADVDEFGIVRQTLGSLHLALSTTVFFSIFTTFFPFYAMWRVRQLRKGVRKLLKRGTQVGSEIMADNQLIHFVDQNWNRQENHFKHLEEIFWTPKS